MVERAGSSSWSTRRSLRLARRSLALAVSWMLFGMLAPPPTQALSLDPAAFVPGSSRQPVNAETQRLGFEVSHVRIPAIGVDETVREGVDLSVIDQGVAHWAGTSSPGGSGNVVLAGHRTTHSAPFRHLDRLRTGDMVFLEDGTGREVMYRVTETLVVTPDDVWITYDAGVPMVTMFACHPKGSARYRIVVTAALVAGGRIG